MLGNYLPTDGIDRSATLSTVGPAGARTSFMYAGKKCRINSYGDSFTQCHQVSDGETWQEYLAAHLGRADPQLRHGRLRGLSGLSADDPRGAAPATGPSTWSSTSGATTTSAASSAAATPSSTRTGTTRAAGCSTTTSGRTSRWTSTPGQFVEKENLLPTRDSLYRMADPDVDGRAPQGRPRLELYAFKLGYIRGLDRERIGQLADRLDVPMDWSEAETLPAQAGGLLDRYSLRATRFILENPGIREEGGEEAAGRPIRPVPGPRRDAARGAEV